MAIYTFENKTPIIHESTYVHPQAAIIGDVEIAGDCFIGPGAVIRGDFGKIRIGPETSIQDNVVIHVGFTEGVFIGGQTVIGHGAILHDVTLNAHVLVAMGSILLPGITCGDHVMIAAGSVVKENFQIPSGVLVAGNPAKILKPLSEEQRTRIHHSVKTYQDLARRYKIS